MIASALIIENGAQNPAGSNGSWQRPLENFATGLVADNDRVYVMDINGVISAFSMQTGASIWNTSSDTGYFSSGLYQSTDKSTVAISCFSGVRKKSDRKVPMELLRRNKHRSLGQEGA